MNVVTPGEGVRCDREFREDPVRVVDEAGKPIAQAAHALA